jgi:hypothetical protein
VDPFDQTPATEFEYRQSPTRKYVNGHNGNYEGHAHVNKKIKTGRYNAAVWMSIQPYPMLKDTKKLSSRRVGPRIIQIIFQQ